LGSGHRWQEWKFPWPPCTPWLRSPAQNLGHDCCAIMDNLCSTLLLLTLPFCECYTGLPQVRKLPVLNWTYFIFCLCFTTGLLSQGSCPKSPWRNLALGCYHPLSPSCWPVPSLAFHSPLLSWV
jgi:hypothetical protein